MRILEIGVALRRMGLRWGLLLSGGLAVGSAVGQTLPPWPPQERLAVSPMEWPPQEGPAEPLFSADSLLAQMTLEEKIAQMMVVRCGSGYDPVAVQDMQVKIGRYGYGGLCFFKGNAWDVYRAVKAYQTMAKIPLWISIDGEWGPAMRLTDVSAFPMQQTLGAIQDTAWISRMGAAVGWQCRQLGISWNFIPVLDVNSNPLNPVINMRSFGENPSLVAAHGAAYARGMRSQGVAGSLKHFPGHGDTEKDSHYTLPEIRHDTAYIDRVDLFPFQALINQGAEAVMIGHLRVPAVDAKLPASISKIWIQDYLRGRMGFKGLTVTDGLEMKGVAEGVKWGSGEVEVRAVEAGEDVLLLPAAPEAAIKAISRAVRSGRIPLATIDSAVYRILKLKAGMLGAFVLRSSDSTGVRPVSYGDSASLLQQLNHPRIQALQNELYARALTVVEDERGILPLRSVRYPAKACIHIGDYEGQAETRKATGVWGTDVFGRMLARYADFDHYYIDKRMAADSLRTLLAHLNRYDLAVIDLGGTSAYLNRRYGITDATIRLLEQLQALPGETVLASFAPPYALALFEKLSFSAVVCGYQDVPAARTAMAQLLFGGIAAQGRLPVSVGTRYPSGTGLTTEVTSLSYGLPEQVGFSSADFRVVDSLVQHGIDTAAYPGCQVLVAYKGKVIYDKNFGHFTYARKQRVGDDDLYDLASLTKVLATTVAYMQLYDRGVYRLDQAISRAVPRLLRTDKKNITFRKLLAHESGLKPSLLTSKPDSYPHRDYLSGERNEEYIWPVADSLYLHRRARRELREEMDKMPLGRPTYQYSDLGFQYLYEAFQFLTDEALEDYVQTHFYDSLGLGRLTFRPLDKFPVARIVPTENDTAWRQRTIRGYVHDPMVALFGGAGGSAGLFGTAHDVAVMAQMLLQYGRYGGHRYIDSATVALFGCSDFSSAKNRRGGGFDKRPLEEDAPSPCASSASSASFGHSGFTGTYFWVDPEKEIVYVFLSNRVHPYPKPNLLMRLSIRTDIQDYIYGLWRNLPENRSQEDTAADVVGSRAGDAAEAIDAVLQPE